MAQKPRRTPQESSKAQQARNPMLAVRVPRSLYRALRKAARDEHRQFPDWFRLNASKLLPIEDIGALSAPSEAEPK